MQNKLEYDTKVSNVTLFFWQWEGLLKIAESIKAQVGISPSKSHLMREAVTEYLKKHNIEEPLQKRKE
jgi:hypothetical protein